MSKNRRNKRQSVGNHQSESVQAQPLEQSSLTVRLPGALARDCKTYSNMIGVSQNALICVALADYLQSKGITARHPV